MHTGGLSLICVRLLLIEPGRVTMAVGRIYFNALPVQTEADYVSVPPAVLSDAEVQAVSADLSRGAVRGRIGRYEWRKSN
jgi:hypothetical protein